MLQLVKTSYITLGSDRQIAAKILNCDNRIRSQMPAC